MISEFTLQRNYPLPVQTNDLAFDVFRMRDALSDIDTDVATLIANVGGLDTSVAALNSSKGAALGIATLDANGKLPAGQLPALAVTDTFVVNTQAAMLALAVEPGDVAVRTDLKKSFILVQVPAATLANWQELLTPDSAVQSVNGHNGTVVLGASDVGAAPASHSHNLVIGDGTIDKIIVGLSERFNIVSGTNVSLSYDDATNTLTINTSGQISGNVASATKLETSRAISLGGNATGSVNFDGSTDVSITVNLVDTGVTPASYGSATRAAVFAVDIDGRMTAASDALITPAFASLTATPTTLGGYGIADAIASSSAVTVAAANKLLYLDANSKLPASITGSATSLATPRNISVSGDATGTVAFNGSADAGIALTLANSGIAPGTYGTSLVVPQYTFDAKGRATAVALIGIAFPVTSVAGRAGTVVLNSGDVGLGNVENKSSATLRSEITYANVAAGLGYTPFNAANMGVANGGATLGADGRLTTAQIPSSLVGAVVYQGVWNASTNSPALASGVGTKGFYYKVGTTGATSVDGINQWNSGDVIIFDGATWGKIDGLASEVVSVNGQVGAVVLNSTNIAEGTNLYFTNLRASSAAPVQSVNNKTGSLTLGTSDVAESGGVLYFTNARASAAAPVQTVAGKSGAVTLTTGDVAEGTGLYFTAARVLSAVLTGLSTASSAVVDATTSVLAAIGQLQAQVSLKANAASPTFTGTSTLPSGWTAPGLLGTASPGVAAAGTTQGTATVLTSDVNVITSGTGGVVAVGAGSARYMLTVNKTSAAINVYPATGHSFDALAANTPISLPIDGVLELHGASGALWYSSLNVMVNASQVTGSFGTLDAAAITSTAVPVAALSIDCSTGNHFTKTIAGASTFTFTGIPTTGKSYGWVLELTVTSGTPSFPAAVHWPGSSTPTFATGKTHLIMFLTRDGGTTVRAAALLAY